jgi:hypothetical protein
MLIGDLIKLLSKYPADQEICTTSRIQHGTHVTSINHVGEDKHGNLVVTFDDSLLSKKESGT